MQCREQCQHPGPSGYQSRSGFADVLVVSGAHRILYSEPNIMKIPAGSKVMNRPRLAASLQTAYLSVQRWRRRADLSAPLGARHDELLAGFGGEDATDRFAPPDFDRRLAEIHSYQLRDA